MDIKAGTESIINSAVKWGKEPQFQGWWKEDGKQVFCNGYTCVRFNTPIETDIPEFKNPVIRAGKFFETVNPETEIETPKIEVLKEMLDTRKKQGSRGVLAYDFGRGRPLVNIEYLISTLECLDNPRTFLWEGHERKPVYFYAENGDAVMKPIYKPPKYEENKYEQSNS